MIAFAGAFLFVVTCTIVGTLCTILIVCAFFSNFDEDEDISGLHPREPNFVQRFIERLH